MSDKPKDRCPCGGIILADTEDWPVPLCLDCYPWHLAEEVEKLQAQLESETEMAIPTTQFAVENITIDQRFKFEQQIKKLKAQLADCKTEIEVLRQYGNKYCTGMADDRLDEIRADKGGEGE